MVDIAVNLTHRFFDPDRDAVLKECFAPGTEIKALLLTGTTFKDSEATVAMCAQYPQYKLFATIGVHPHNAKRFTVKGMARLVALLESPETRQYVKAVGECGLDYHHNCSSRAEQIKCFEAHLGLAIRYRLPLFLHERHAHREFLEVLDRYADEFRVAGVRVVVHCFTGTRAEAEEYVKRGFYIGITGWLCDVARNAPLLDALEVIPLDRLMIETDSPFLSPLGDGRNSPANLPLVLDRLAQTLKLDRDHLATVLLNNTVKFLDLPPL